MIGLFCMMLAATGRGERALSEAELLRQYPSLQIAFGLLFLTGLITDIWLLWRWGHVQTTAFKVRPKPWGVHDLLLATGALILTLLTGMGLMALLIRHTDSAWFLAGDCALRVAFLLGLLIFLRHRQATLDWNWTPLGVVGFFAVLPPLALAGAALVGLYKWLDLTPTPQPVALLFVETTSKAELTFLMMLALVIAPVFEEVFFRGFAYPALKQRLGTLPALLLVSAIFAAIHLHLDSAVPLFVLAIGLTLAYEWTGSLMAPITMHALFNATNVAVLWYVRLQS